MTRNRPSGLEGMRVNRAMSWSPSSTQPSSGTSTSESGSSQIASSARAGSGRLSDATGDTARALRPVALLELLAGAARAEVVSPHVLELAVHLRTRRDGR